MIELWAMNRKNPLSYLLRYSSLWVCGKDFRKTRHWPQVMYSKITDCGLPLLTAEDFWFFCDLYLQFKAPINLWNKCIDLRLFFKCKVGPFLRPLRSKDDRCWILWFQVCGFVVKTSEKPDIDHKWCTQR